MTTIVMQSNASGTGSITFSAPNTNTNRTLTLPDASGSLLESSNPVISQLNGGQLAGFRNKIINGKMDISQRGTSFVSPVAGAYQLDRFNLSGVPGAALFTVTQQADAPANNEFQYSYRAAVTTADTSIAAGEGTWIQHAVEGYNARDLIGKTFTLSFWVRSSKTGTHCVSWRNSGTDRSYVAEYTVSAANTWQYKSITVSGGLLTAGTWNWTNGVGVYLTWALACGSTFQTTANAWQTGNFLATANQVNCLDTVSNGSTTGIFAITGVQLEVGSVATPFEHRPYGTELALCQRYYQLISGGFTGPVTSTIVYGAQVIYPITPRTTPSVAYVSADLTDSGFPVGAATVGGINPRSVQVYKTANASINGAQWASTFSVAAEL